MIIAMPTMGQTKSILFRLTAQIMLRLSAFVNTLKTDINTTTEKVYRNGAILKAISVEQMRDKVHPPEGYNCVLLVIDEAHRATRDILAICLPFLTQAKLKGIDKIILLGVGGHVKSLIEEMKEDENTRYVPLHISAATIVSEDIAYEAVFADFKRELPPFDYDQMVLCKVVTEGGRYLFNDVCLTIPFTGEQKSGREELYFGIDVGRTNDVTCVTVMREKAGYKDIISRFETVGTGQVQAQQIFEFIDKYYYNSENIVVEINGVGAFFIDHLREKFPFIKGVFLTEKLKAGLITTLIKDIRDGKIRVEKEEWKQELEHLQFEIKVDGSFDFKLTHSDFLSSILMSISSKQKAFAFV